MCRYEPPPASRVMSEGQRAELSAVGCTAPANRTQLFSATGIWGCDFHSSVSLVLGERGRQS